MSSLDESERRENPRDKVNKKLHKMVFIYNAVMNGWKVRLRSDGTFKFTQRRKDTVEKESISIDFEDDELREFVSELINIHNLL